MFILLTTVFILSYIDIFSSGKDELEDAYRYDYSKYLTKSQWNIIVCFCISIVSVLFTAVFWSVSEIIAQIISVIGWH